MYSFLFLLVWGGLLAALWEAGVSQGVANSRENPLKNSLSGGPKNVAAHRHRPEWELNELRENWLNPPEWTRTETLEFPGSVDGPWARYVEDPDDRGIGTVRYDRTVPAPEHSGKLKKRTLTNLYNENPTWLRNALRRLDEAVCTAYRRTTGDPEWSADMDDEQILEKLLELNLQRAGTA